MLDEDLLPCPFCGGDAKTIDVVRIHGGSYSGRPFHVICEDCGSRSKSYQYRHQATGAWKNRE